MAITKRIFILIVIVVLLVSGVFVGKNIAFNKQNNINNFDVDLAGINYSTNTVYSKYITNFKKIKVVKVCFDNSYFDLFMERINDSSISYEQIEQLKEKELIKYVEYDKNSIVLSGSYPLKNSSKIVIKQTTGYITVVINRGKSETTVFICDKGIGSW